MKDLFGLIFRKPAKILLLLTEDKVWYLSNLARESDQSYAYVASVVKFLEDKKIVSCGRKGKKRIVKLTEKGAKIAHAFNEIREEIKEEQAKLQSEVKQ